MARGDGGRRSRGLVVKFLRLTFFRRTLALPILATLIVAGCATRVPVVTTPAYPDFRFPAVPLELAAGPAAAGHADAWTYLQAGQVQEAQRRFAAVLAESPEFYPADAGLGWIQVALGDLPAAVERFDRAIARAPAYVPALLGKGEVLLETDRSDEALASFEAALAADPALTEVGVVVQELRFGVMTEQLETARAAASAGRLRVAETAYERVIASSPESAFLYVELARVEQQRGSTTDALSHVRLAETLDPQDATAFLVEGEIHEAAGDLEQAEVAYARADTVDPTDDASERLGRVRERLRLEALPARYREIPAKAAVTRGELAALMGVRLGELLEEASDGAVIITDTRNHWGNRWILTVTGAGVMDVDAGYRFEPERAVRRGDLAEVVAAVLDLTGELEPDPAETAERQFSDMGSGHLNHASAVWAVASGVLETRAGNIFQPTAAVTGAEAVETVRRLEALARD